MLVVDGHRPVREVARELDGNHTGALEVSESLDGHLWVGADQLVLGQATFAFLMVWARRMTLRSLGSVACRFRQAM
jgi:hypothetical protein